MSLPSKPNLPCYLRHNLLGNCTLVRIEGVHWVVAFGTMELRVPPSQFAAYEILGPVADAATEENDFSPTVVSPNPLAKPVVGTESAHTASGESEEQLDTCDVTNPQVHPAFEQAIPPSSQVVRPRLRRAIRSLTTGLSPEDPELTLSLSVGLEEPFDALDRFYQDVSARGAAMVVRGAYGCGKTLTLQSAKAKALAKNFVCSETEIDSSEVRLDQAPTIYATLIRSLRFPDGGRGLGHLLDLFEKWLVAARAPHGPAQLYNWLEKRIECSYLAWILAAKNLRQTREFMEALKGVPIPLSKLRAAHPLPNEPGRWQYFKFGTQGDVGSYLISGVAKLVNLLGFSGLIMALDEMEKWQDLDWKNQDRASNLLGGLIWGATASEGNRECTYRGNGWDCSHSQLMNHSAFNRGCRFSTPSPCHLGVLIAMTPRGKEAPEYAWQNYGELKIIDLPSYTLASFFNHFAKITTIFEQAYELVVPIDEVQAEAEAIWRGSSDRSARSGSLAITEALENWRRQNG